VKLRSCTYGLAILASVALLAIPATLAQAAESQDLHWSQDRISKLNAALASWQQDFAKQQVRQALEDRLSRFNAAIASLEQDVAKQNVASRAKAEAALKALQDTRDAFRAKVKEPQASMTDDQVAASAFRAGLNVYLDAVNADIETRQAVMQPQFVKLRSN
jgi:hypothetical protein